MKISQMSSTLGIVRSRSRSGHDFKLYLHLPQYKLSSPIPHITDKCNVNCFLIVKYAV